MSPESGAAPAEHRPYTLVAELTYRCPLRCPYCSNLEALIEAARALDLYTNLSTSGIPLTRERLARLRTLGLDSVQLSIQDVTAERKLEVARWVKELGFPLTVNTVLHRDNLDHVGEIVALAERLSADRLELANTQYLGWALLNRGRSFRREPSWTAPGPSQARPASACGAGWRCSSSSPTTTPTTPRRAWTPGGDASS